MRNLLQLLLSSLSIAPAVVAYALSMRLADPTRGFPGAVAAGKNIERRVDRTAAALYASKSAGRNRVTGHRAVSVTAVHPEEIPT